MEPNQPIEKPLSPARRVLLLLSAAASIFLFYTFVTATLLTLAIIISAGLIGVIVALRFGLAGTVASLLRPKVSLATRLIRSIRIQRRRQFRLDLQESDTPQLFAILNKLGGQLGVAPPKTVCLEMSSGAWVQLKGVLKGRGATTLGVGYDLLAGLSNEEVEAVLAHEMAHAKLMRRGVNSWLWSGLSGARIFSNTVADHLNDLHAVNQNSAFADGIYNVADRLTRLIARLAASYSRQNEFDADRAAAGLCGSRPMGSALVKVEALSQIASRLTWTERVTQLEFSGGLREWLAKEFGTKELESKPDPTPVLTNRYSTHPLIRDRLAALPDRSGTKVFIGASSLNLLAQPDEIAKRLVAEIERTLAIEENLDAAKLQRQLKSAGRSLSQLQPLQVAGVVVLIIGLLVGVFALFADDGGWIYALVGGLLAMAGGTLAYFGRPKLTLTVPFPSFSQLKAATQMLRDPNKTKARTEEVTAELRAKVGSLSAKKAKKALLMSEAVSALQTCDYIRTKAAGQICVEVAGQSPEASLVGAIGQSILSGAAAAVHSRRAVLSTTSLRTPTAAWGLGWSALLSGSWGEAEACFSRALEVDGRRPVVLMCLAFAQSKRGKTMSAIMAAREACTPVPPSIDDAKVFVDLLLAGGHAREAAAILQPLSTVAETDKELMMSMLRLEALRQAPESAIRWAQRLAAASEKCRTLIDIAGIFETVRLDARAGEYFRQALTLGHCPEALIGLARLETVAGLKPLAKEYLLRALNLETAVAEGTLPPRNLVQAIINQLHALEDMVPKVEGWIIRPPGDVTPKDLANTKFLVFTPDRPTGEKHLFAVLKAMSPAISDDQLGRVEWRRAPRRFQPDEAGRPGVVAMMS